MTYRVVVTREEGAWLAELTSGEGGATWSPDGLAKLDTYVREVVVLMNDLPSEAKGSVDLDWVFEVTDDDLVDAVAEARGATRAEVLAKGWSLADVAALLKVPAERVTLVPPPGDARVAHA